MKIIHVGDLHVTPGDDASQDAIFETIRSLADDAELVVLAGDLTEMGRPEEYRALRRLVRPFREKAVLIRGNHDAGFFMDALADEVACCAAEIRFDRHELPMHEWKAHWWAPCDSNAKAFDLTRRLPSPYDATCQVPTVKLIDGTGPYYSFERGGYRFIVLDTCRWILGENQYAFLEGELERSKAPTLILLHHTILPTGSYFDGAVLWDKDRLIELILREPCILGVFSGHVHYNRIWDLAGKKIVSTADRGGIRRIDLSNGAVAGIESLGNVIKPGSGAVAPCDLSDQGERPFELRYLFASRLFAAESFRVTAPDMWTSHPKAVANECFGWVDDESPAGVEWRVPNLDGQKADRWFGINFRSSSDWKVTVTRGEEVVFEEKGSPVSRVVGGRMPAWDGRGYTIRLEQKPPARGHASPFAVFDGKPVRSFRRYA